MPTNSADLKPKTIRPILTGSTCLGHYTRNLAYISSLHSQTNTTNRFATGTTRGWCANISAKDSGRLKTDKTLIPALADLFTGKTEN